MYLRCTSPEYLTELTMITEIFAEINQSHVKSAILYACAVWVLVLFMF